MNLNNFLMELLGAAGGGGGGVGAPRVPNGRGGGGGGMMMPEVQFIDMSGNPIATVSGGGRGMMGGGGGRGGGAGNVWLRGRGAVRGGGMGGGRGGGATPSNPNEEEDDDNPSSPVEDANAPGHIFRGEMPPMLWIQQEQRAAAAGGIGDADEPVVVGGSTDPTSASSPSSLPAGVNSSPRGTPAPSRPATAGATTPARGVNTTTANSSSPSSNNNNTSSTATNGSPTFRPTAAQIATALDLRQRGNRAMGDGRLDIALQLYTQAIHLNPTDELNFSNRALVFIKLNNPSAAATDAKKCLELNPLFYKGHYRLATAQMMMGAYEDAIVRFMAALELAPSDTEREDIKRSIAKCESKLATSGGTTTTSASAATAPSSSAANNDAASTTAVAPTTTAGAPTATTATPTPSSNNVPPATPLTAEAIDLTGHGHDRFLVRNNSSTFNIDQHSTTSATTSSPATGGGGDAFASPAGGGALTVAASSPAADGINISTDDTTTTTSPAVSRPTSAATAQNDPRLSKALESALARLNVETKPKVAYEAPPRLPELNVKYEKISGLVDEVVKTRRQEVQQEHMGTPPIVAQALHFANRFDHSAAVRKIIGLTDMTAISSALDECEKTQEALRAASAQKNRTIYHVALAKRDETYATLADKVEKATAAVEAITLLAEDAKRCAAAINAPCTLPQIMPPPGVVCGGGAAAAVGNAPTAAQPPQPAVPPTANTAAANTNEAAASTTASSNTAATSATAVDPQDVLSKDEVQTLLTQLEKAEKKVYTQLATSVKRTDASAQQLIDALEAERKDHEELSVLLSACRKIKERLRCEYVDIKTNQLAKPTTTAGAASAAASGSPTPNVVSPTTADPTPAHTSATGGAPVVAACYRPTPPVSEQQLEALASTVPRLKRLRSDVASFEDAGRRGHELLEMEAQLEHERLRQERHRIQLKAELEWLSVKEEEDLTRQTRLREAIALCQQRVNRIVEQQSAVHQELLKLIQGDRPELQWSASAGGNKILRWLKGSGLWLNRSFSDFQIVSTLASTFSSKVYLARTRHGDEVTLKEVPVEDDKKRRIFQNEINVMLSVTNHPNVVKLQGVFFDGPFAYIVMPYYNAGSFKTFLGTLAARQKLLFHNNTNNNTTSGGSSNNTTTTATAGGRPSSALVPFSPSSAASALAAVGGAANGANVTDAIINNDLTTATSIPWHKLQELLRQVVGGIAFLHEKGVIHQDIKPSNILLSAEGYCGGITTGSTASSSSGNGGAMTALAPAASHGVVGYHSPNNALSSNNNGNNNASGPLDFANLIPAITDFGIAKDIGQLGEKDFTMTMTRQHSVVEEVDDDADESSNSTNNNKNNSPLTPSGGGVAAAASLKNTSSTAGAAVTSTNKAKGKSVVNAGTFDYMAPERQDGTSRHATPKSDVWSLGMTMYAIAAANALLSANAASAAASAAEEGGSSGTSPPTPANPFSDVLVLPFLSPNDTHIEVDPQRVGGNERLADLLSQMLSRDPSKRPTAMEILAHPYFTISQVEDYVSNRALVESNKKMNAFRSYLHVLRQQYANPVLVSVTRSQMVESVTNIMTHYKEDDLLSPLFVVFRGEDGVDEGALTSEMFSLYYQQSVTKDRLLVSAETGHNDSDVEGGGGSSGGGSGSNAGGGGGTARRAAVAISPNAEYLPSSDPRIPISWFNVLGKVLLKSLVENRNVPFHLSPVIFKYFLGVKVGLSDLETYDRSLAQNLKRLLIFGEEELLAASLDFSDISSKFLASWAERNAHSWVAGGATAASANVDGPTPPSNENTVTNTNTSAVASSSTPAVGPTPDVFSPPVTSPLAAEGSSSPTPSSTATNTTTATSSSVVTFNFTRDTPVTVDNVRFYIQIRCEYELIGKREEQLEAMKKGFFMSKVLEPHLTLFSVAELLMQITGHQHIPPQAVINALQFVDFPSTSQTPQHLKEIILGFSQMNLRRFLMLCTPHVVIPATGLPAIKIQRTADLRRLPVGHGCVSQLDVPDYNNKEVLREKLGVALQHVNDGFFVR